MIAGLTGGIASGKSTVTRMLRDMGAYVVDADVWARKVVEPGSPGLAEIAEAFGSRMVRQEGTLDRAALAALIFHDAQAREQLNAITHPRVRQGMQAETQQVQAEHPNEPVVWDVPLLFEGETVRLVDVTILVYVDEALQLARLIERDRAPIADAQARIAAQMPIAAKRQLADYIIDNSGTIEQTREQVQHVWRILRSQMNPGCDHSS